jgi:hypothetical protein
MIKSCWLISMMVMLSCSTTKIKDIDKDFTQKKLQDFYCVYFTREFKNDSLIILYKNKPWKTGVLLTDQSLSLAKKYYLPRKGFKDFSISINSEYYYAFRDGDSCDFYNVSKIKSGLKIKCYEKEPRFY